MITQEGRTAAAVRPSYRERTTDMALILASASPRRRELMGLITPEFIVETSDVDESGITAATPALLAQELATAKCRAVAAHHPREVVIGCDTVVDLDGAVLGKPADREEARAMIRALSGREHLVHTGVCIRQGDRADTFAETTRVEFYPLSDEEIEAYISTPEPYDKAGAYAVQGGAARYVKQLVGCYFNVMGLPVSAVYRHLSAF